MTAISLRPRRGSPFTSELLSVGLLGAAAIVVAAAAATFGAVVLAALVVTIIVGAVLVWPAAAALLFIASVPFLAGIDRGTLIPLLRPNEALQFLLMAALALRIVIEATAGRSPTWRVTRLDLTLITLALLGSVVPLLWLGLRGEPLTFSEVIATVPLWRLFALYALIRLTVTSDQLVRVCLWTSIVVANVVALIAIAQVLDAPGVQSVLASYWAPGGSESAITIGRGTATLSSSHAAGDYLAFNLAIALGMLFTNRDDLRPLLFVPLLLVGTLASGQFSGALALAIVLIAVAVTMRRTRAVLLGGGLAVIAGGVLLWPAISIRLSEFAERGWPQSWTVRWDNLATYYLPDILDFGWLLGVRPNSVVEAQELWRTTIFLESGYLWFLWVGGLPLLLAFVWFAATALKLSFAVARERTDAIGVAGIAVFSALAAICVLTLFDPHLTLRGAGDLLYVLMALTVLGAQGAARRQPAAPTGGATATFEGGSAGDQGGRR